MAKVRHWCSALLIATIGLWSAAHVRAQTEQICFAETNQCISGRIRAYWEANGGLAVFGYPITAEQPEVNRDTGATYPTQWFERNRLEVHAENDAPYDVLIGRLGDDRLRQQNVDWQALPPETARDECLYVETTGHNICDQASGLGFKTYFETHGLDLGYDGQDWRESLALFGYPITDARMETNSSGDTVLTQWFERARMEWHPDNPDQFKVLLGLLGNDVRAALDDTTPIELTPEPTPPPTPKPRPDPSPQPTPELPPASFNNCQTDPTVAPNYPVTIVDVDKEREVVTLRNVSDAPVDLAGWRMCSITGNQEHLGIGGVLGPREAKSYQHTGGNIWNNGEPDDGALYNANGQLISFWNDPAP